jgi:hypothetical protein
LTTAYCPLKWALRIGKNKDREANGAFLSDDPPLAVKGFFLARATVAWDNTRKLAL